MMPMLGYSLLALFVRRGSFLGVVGVLSSAWCARLAALGTAHRTSRSGHGPHLNIQGEELVFVREDRVVYEL